jgi:serine/threonine protein kinase
MTGRDDGFELQGSGAQLLEDEDPRWIGPIPLMGRLGSGGMGRVYLGVHEGQYAAVKQVLPSFACDKNFLRRFGHELDNLARLPAQATAPLLDSDRTARPPWLATAYIPGLTLREAVELHGYPLPADALWLLLREAAAGLAAVHALDMVHRDLKPSNVMLTLDGLTLIDFGVARAADQSQLTRTGMAVGTPAYMSPEQAAGVQRLTGAVDVFALGSVVAYAACGRPPFGDDSGHGVLYRIVHDEPDLDPLRELDPELAEVIATCMDKDPERRLTAAALLQRAEEHGPSVSPLWPPAITERLAERDAFAARVPDPDTLKQVASQETEEPEERQLAGTRKEPVRRRSRVLLAVVPVVIVIGTILGFQLMPYTSSPQDGARATPSTSISPSLTPLPSPSDTGARSSSPPPTDRTTEPKTRASAHSKESVPSSSTSKRSVPPPPVSKNPGPLPSSESPTSKTIIIDRGHGNEMNINMAGFGPGKDVTIYAYTDTDATNGSYDQKIMTIDADGKREFGAFPMDAYGQYWVVAEGVESNRYDWAGR